MPLRIINHRKFRTCYTIYIITLWIIVDEIEDKQQHLCVYGYIYKYIYIYEKSSPGPFIDDMKFLGTAQSWWRYQMEVSAR